VNSRIAAQRLDNQRLTRLGPRDPADLVAWFGAVQAQDYPAAKWALGLRMPDGTTDARIERAFNDGRILRTHVLRPTWHFVAASDLHWMLELTAPRVHRGLTYGYRMLELDLALRNRAAGVIERALGDGHCLTRAELGAHLLRAGLAAKGVRLALLTMHAELERVICSGPLRGKESTYALLARRAANPRRMSRDEALAELAWRYFRSHGPATIRDYVWWAGLTVTDAKRGLEISRARHEAIGGLTYWTLGRPRAMGTRRGRVHLLPIYDEYLVAYRDLEAVPRAKAAWGILQQSIIAGGQVAGTWKPIAKDDARMVEVKTLRKLTSAESRALAQTAARYGRFLGMPVSISRAATAGGRAARGRRRASSA
jgi:hypothetical protein